MNVTVIHEVWTDTVGSTARLAVVPLPFPKRSPVWLSVCVA